MLPTPQFNGELLFSGSCSKLGIASLDSKIIIFSQLLL